MGSTYEKDRIDAKDAIELTILAATVVKALGNLIACRSWLQARLALRCVQEQMGRMAAKVEKGSK